MSEDIYEGLEEVNDEELKGLELDGKTEGFENMILLPLEAINDVDIDSVEFRKGLKEYSYIAGAITAMTNAGASAVDALGYLLNVKIAEVNMVAMKLKCKAQVDSAKYMRDNVEKDIL